MGKLRSPYNKDWITDEYKERNKITKIKDCFCPLCTDDEGHFATIKLFFNRDTNYINECQCNGQIEKCVILQILKCSYNTEILNKK